MCKAFIKGLVCSARGVRAAGKGAYISFLSELKYPRRITIGEGVVIEKYSRLLANGENAKIIIADYTTIYPYALLKANSGTISIGKGCSVNDYCVLNGFGGISIGDDVHIAAHTVIVASEHKYEKLGSPDFSRDMQGKGIHIESSVWIGANSVILDGVTIGAHSVIGAGAVVTKDIPPYCIACGVPAREIRRLR